MSFNIEEIPFYKALKLFEADKLKESYPIFLDLAKQGNLYALYYVEYLLKTISELKDKKEDKEADEFLESLPRYIEDMPTKVSKEIGFSPKAWLESSLLIRAFNEIQNDPPKKKQGKKDKKNKAPSMDKDTIIRNLRELSKNAANAVVFIFDYDQKNNAQNLEHINRLLEETDLLALHKLQEVIQAPHKMMYVVRYQAQNSRAKGIANDIDLVKKQLETFKKPGELETFLGSYHVKQLSSPNCLDKTQFSQVRAAYWQFKGAYLGYPAQQLIYAGRESIPKDAGLWLKAAARNGQNLWAIIKLMEHTYLCDKPGIKQDQSTAVILAKQVLAHKDAADIKEYRSGLANANYILAIAEINKENYTKVPESALAYLEQALQFGNITANLYLGKYYIQVKQLDKAIQHLDFYIKNKPDGDPESLLYSAHELMGNIYKNGDSKTPINIPAAIQHYKIAAAHSISAEGHYYVLLYLDKESKKLKPEIAKQGFEALYQATLRGSFIAAHCITCLILNGSLTKEDLQTIDINKVASLLFSTPQEVIEEIPDFTKVAGTFLIQYANTAPQLKLGIRFLEPLAATNATIAILLGSLYFNGNPNLKFPASPSKAITYFETAANLGAPEGLYNHASVLLECIDKKPQEIHKAIDLYQAALKKGMHLAGYHLYRIYYFGKGGIQPDYKLAFKYLKEAEPSQNSDVLYRLGLFYVDKDGPEFNEGLALHYFKESYKKGHTSAGFEWAIIKFNRHIKNKDFNSQAMEDILSTLADDSCEKGNKTWVYATFKLLLEIHQLDSISTPDRKINRLEILRNNISSCIKTLEEYLRGKEDSRCQEFVTLLKERSVLTEHPLFKGADIIIPREIVFFCLEEMTSPLSTLKQIYEIFTLIQKPPSIDAAKIPETGSSAKSAPPKPSVQPEKPDTKEIYEKNEIDNLVEWFTNRKNIKSIDTDLFKKVVAKIAEQGTLECEIQDTKNGFKIESRRSSLPKSQDPSEGTAQAPLVFSTHREHGWRTNNVDKRVAHKMQEYVSTVARIAKPGASSQPLSD